MLFKKGFYLKPAQILNLSKFCSKNSEVKIIQLMDGEGLECLVEFIRSKKRRRLGVCSKRKISLNLYKKKMEKAEILFRNNKSY